MDKRTLVIIIIIAILALSIIPIMILTSAVIWTGADTPEQSKQLLFYNDLASIQDAVVLKIMNNNMEIQYYENDDVTSKYYGLINENYIDKELKMIDETIEPTAILNIDGDEIKVYALLESSVEVLDLSLDEEDIQNFAIDEEGKVYFYKGVILDAKNKQVANVTKDLTIAATKESINIADY